MIVNSSVTKSTQPLFGSSIFDGTAASIGSRIGENYRAKKREKEFEQEKQEIRAKVLAEIQMQRPDLFTPTSSLTRTVLDKPLVTLLRQQARFEGSAAAVGGAIAADHYYRKTHPECGDNPIFNLPVPVSNNTRIPYQVIRPNQPAVPPSKNNLPTNPIRFGLNTSWLIDIVTGSIASKALEYLIDGFQGTKGDDNKRALAYLELAHKATGHSSQAFYLKKAETKLINVTQSSKKDLERAKAYKSLALISTMLGRPRSITKSYIEKAIEYYESEGTNIEALRSSIDGMAVMNSPFLLHNHLKLQQAERTYNENKDIVEVCTKLRKQIDELQSQPKATTKSSSSSKAPRDITSSDSDSAGELADPEFKEQKKALFKKIDKAAKAKRNPFTKADALKRRVDDGRVSISKAEKIIASHLPEGSDSSDDEFHDAQPFTSPEGMVNWEFDSLVGHEALPARKADKLKRRVKDGNISWEKGHDIFKKYGYKKLGIKGKYDDISEPELSD